LLFAPHNVKEITLIIKKYIKSRQVAKITFELPRTKIPEGIEVVSMPSWELFEKQSQGYRDSVLPPDLTARVSVEQASTLG
jgi:transketolase